MADSGEKKDAGEKKNRDKKLQANRIPSMWEISFSPSEVDAPGCFIVCAKNPVHARKRMKNAFLSGKYAENKFPFSRLDMSDENVKNQKVSSYNHHTKEWVEHPSFIHMIENAWVRPYAENMIIFSALDG